MSSCRIAFQHHAWCRGTGREGTEGRIMRWWWPGREMRKQSYRREMGSDWWEKLDRERDIVIRTIFEAHGKWQEWVGLWRVLGRRATQRRAVLWAAFIAHCAAPVTRRSLSFVFAVHPGFTSKRGQLPLIWSDITCMDKRYRFWATGTGCAQNEGERLTLTIYFTISGITVDGSRRFSHVFFWEEITSKFAWNLFYGFCISWIWLQHWFWWWNP